MDLNLLTAEFLGIPTTTDPRILLGMTTGRTDHIAIKNALRRRLAQIHVHPTGHTREASEIREHLQSIAAEFIKTSPQHLQHASQPATELTPLDQAIIAALIGEGGWNKNSRSRLVGIAASYSLTVGGLIRILEAFADAARSGRGPLSLKQRSTHSIDRTWTSIPTKSVMSVVDSFIANTAKRFTPELNAPTPIMTLKLSVLFGLLTVLAFVLSLQVLLSESEQHPNERQVVQSTFPSQESNVEQKQVITYFENYPTFFIDGIERSMLQYADRGVDQPLALASIAKSISDSFTKGEEPTSTIIEDWNTSIDSLSYGWPFIDSPTLQASVEQLVQVLLQAEMYPEYSNRLLLSLDIPSLKIGFPEQIARATWTSGVLAMLSCDQRLTIQLRSQVKKMQQGTFTTCDALEASSLALIRISDSLFERTEFDTRLLEMWEAWFIVVRQLQNITNTSEHQVHLIESILHSDLDLLRESNTRQVLGRVVQTTDWSASSTARDSICQLISSPIANTLDIAILTHLFLLSKQTPWFRETYLIDQDTPLQDRIRIAQRLKNDWPLSSTQRLTVWNLSIPIGFNPQLIQEWDDQVNRLLRYTDGDILQFPKLRILNEAAVSIWKGRPDLAVRAINRSKQLDLETSNHFHPIHYETDGTFTDHYLAARKDQVAQTEAIDTLYNAGETDLGVRDADLLASIALSSSKSRLRKAATRAIIDQFKNGRNVAIAIVQYISKARTKEQITSLVAHLTNVILPEQQSPEWLTVARLALVQHALTVGNTNLWELDEISNEIATSLLAEFFLLNPEVLPLSTEADAFTAIDMVVDSWNRLLPPNYVPVNQVEFNPTGILQKFLLKQLEYYSLLQAEESRWRSERQPVNNIQLLLNQLLQKKSILEQLVTAEIAIALHWSHLFKEVNLQYERRINQ